MNVRQQKFVDDSRSHWQILIPWMIVFVNDLVPAQIHQVLLLGLTDGNLSCELRLKYRDFRC